MCSYVKEDNKMAEQAIKIENLTKKFEEKTALENLNLQVNKGELFGLLGPNGAGKTTTINILCGLIKPTNGTAQVYGYDVQKETDKVKELIGVCTQETAIYPYLTGKENIELFGNLHCMNKKALKERSKILLNKMGLTDDAKRVAAKYSGGMKRRLSLILALIHDPQVLFLDEPTVAMDPQSRHAVWDFIKEQKTEGKTIILTTHYMEEAEELCTRVGIIDHGQLIALGTPKEFIVKAQVKNLEELFIQLTGRTMREEA
jgi:ABC-2 type transport system ATP-binding protein